MYARLKFPPVRDLSDPGRLHVLLRPISRNPGPLFEPSMRRLKVKNSRKQQRLSESVEIQVLDQWIEARKPDSGTNPLAIPPPASDAPVGRMQDGGFTPYSGCKLFRQLPISRKTKEALTPKYKEMSEIQRASLPHSLCGRDILGAAKTGSGKTLAFIIPVVEKLYRARWGPEDGVGSIIISPTKELAGQLFEELKIVGKKHNLSAGLLIGGRKDVDVEKDSVSSLNVLICTPGRLLQHMNETPNFECSQLQVLVLDEADRMLDKKFKGELDAIISQLPKRRQTLLFSATQTKSVKDLARLSLKDPEYISVHAESTTATPERLKQVAMEVALDQKLNMLWSFIKSHLRSKMIVFLSTCKQVKFVYEAFRKLRPGIPLKCLHGNMKQNTRMAVYLDFCETTSVLFSTDVASRGLDFPSVDWVIQVDCPENIEAYIHRVGRTARFTSEGNSLLFLAPSEKAMLTKLQSVEPKIPIMLRKVKVEKIEQISGALASVLAKYPDLQRLAIRAFITYVRSINHQKDKDVFDVSRLPLEEYSASLGLFMTPKIIFKSQKMKNKNEFVDEQKTKLKVVGEDEDEDEPLFSIKQMPNGNNSHGKAEEEDDILQPMNSFMEGGPTELAVLPPIISKKKKKLKIVVDRPVRTVVKYDEDGNQITASCFATESPDTGLEPEKVMERYKKMALDMKQGDKEDKRLQHQRLREKKAKKKIKLKRSRDEDEGDDDDDISESERRSGEPKNTKIRFESDEEDGREMKKVNGLDADAISLAEQEALALKLLSSMH